MIVAPRAVDHLLIGGGLATAACAQTLREEGAPGSVLVVGRELDPPYHRPPLSKGYLQGREDRGSALVHPPEWWDEQAVELLTRTSVMKLDPAERMATLSNKEKVRFGTALIATGAIVRRLRAAGGDLDGIHYLRAFGNADAIRADAEQASRVVLIGGSYIGCEVAASLVAAFGCECTILMQEEITFERQFGREVGGFFARVLAEHGVKVHGCDELERFEGAEGRVGRVVTKGGLKLDCDCVVIGAGVMPDVMLARAAGLELGERGGEVLVTARDLRCRHLRRRRHVRVRQPASWTPPASGALGRGQGARQDGCAEHDGARHAPRRAALLLRRSRRLGLDGVRGLRVGRARDPRLPRGGEFTAFYLEEGKVTAALTVGRSEDLEHARRLIATGSTPDPGELADPEVALAPVL